MTAILLVLVLVGRAFGQAHVDGNSGPSKIGGGPGSVWNPATTTTTTTVATTTTTAAATTTTTAAASTTTTMAGTAVPSWVPSMLAAWMLDETSGNRVNLQGTTARDLSGVDGTDPGSSALHQEGTRSMSVALPQARHTVDTFPSLTTAQSMGCWVNVPSGPPFSAAFIMHNYADGAVGTTKLAVDPAGDFTFASVDDGGTTHVATSAPMPYAAWTHVAGTLVSGVAILVYVNGKQAGTAAMTTAVASANPLFLSDNYVFSGLLDECFVTDKLLTATSVCRICSCGVRGEQCTCAGTSFLVIGRNITACGGCALPADCGATTPP